MVKTKPSVYDIIILEVIAMDQIKMGEFISELRREKGLTQEELGERLGVTNKTVSRWETGKYLPPIEVLLEMTTLFDVSINELLCGMRLDNTEYKAKAEENLVRALGESKFTLKEKIDFYKKKWIRDHVALLVFIGVCILATMLSGIIFGREWLVVLSFFALPTAHAWRNNAMMIYVEKRAFDKEDKNT